MFVCVCVDLMFCMCCLLGLRVRGDVLDGVVDGEDLVRLVVGDLERELLLDGHHHLHKDTHRTHTNTHTGHTQTHTHRTHTERQIEK